jgi:hypothetical protein
MPEAEALTVLENFIAPSSDVDAAGSATVAGAGGGKKDAVAATPVASVPTPDTGAITVAQPETDAGQGQSAPKKALPFVPTIPDLPNLPTPGGIGLLLLIVLVVLFAIVPVSGNGQTRLQLMWSVLAGKAQFVSTAQQSAAPSVPW